MTTGAPSLIITIAAVLLLTGCGTDGGGRDPAPAPEPSPATSPTRDAPAFPDNTARQTSSASGGSPLVLVDVRVDQRPGFSRIVLEFNGNGLPGWAVNYVDTPVLEGSGDVVDLGAGAVLDIYASNTTWPAPDYYSGPDQFTPRSGGAVSRVQVGGTFEGYTQVLAGIEGEPVPFRVFARAAPSRLVVDVVRPDR